MNELKKDLRFHKSSHFGISDARLTIGQHKN